MEAAGLWLPRQVIKAAGPRPINQIVSLLTITYTDSLVAVQQRVVFPVAKGRVLVAVQGAAGQQAAPEKLVDAPIRVAPVVVAGHR